MSVIAANVVPVALLLMACAIRSDRDDDSHSAPVEVCEPGIRNDEWGIDCSAACNHVMACKASYSDSNIRELTCKDCLGSCVVGVDLGGNDVVEGTEEDRKSWQCAELVEGCSALDHNCDLF